MWSSRRPGDGFQAESLYKKLTGYLCGAYELLAVNKGVIEASGVHFYGVVLLEEANHKLRDVIARVERIVDHILAPTTPPLPEERLRLGKRSLNTLASWRRLRQCHV